MKIPEIKMPDQRSKRFIFIPFCLICQSFQAQGIVRHGHRAVIKPVIEEILKHDVNIIQMLCPESQLGGYKKGLGRKPRGIKQYDTPEFRRICQRLAQDTVDVIKAILVNGYKIVAVLGIEYSPSCSVKLQYSHQGTFHRPGIFIETLKAKLAKEKIKIPFLGINRRGLKKSLSKLGKLLKK